MKRYDKSLIEVWEWKERVYREVKDLAPNEYVKKIKNDAEKILSESHISLNPISLKEKHLKAVKSVDG